MSLMQAAKQFPFLWGSAYYRAPEPDATLWAEDFRKMEELGFTDLKYLVQWRWSHIGENDYYFDDTKKLLDLAATHSMRVTLNFLLDVSPHWLFSKYPDAKPVMNNGRIVEPYAVGHRAIGGHPGPCYNHPAAREERMKFLRQTVTVFKDHPALSMWDVWNEPELCFPQRSPIQIEKLACYCSNCHKRFIDWLQKKYDGLEELNRKWGRNYRNWKEVEMARSPEAFLDFVDWREFQGSTMTDEASWRIRLTKELDRKHTVFLHVVPNTMNPFNAVTTCTDDFDVAAMCDVFAATTIGPLFTTQLVSAGRGKVCYNVECHINGGGTSMHPKVITLDALLDDFIPQLGLGIKGFMFWQFRPEVLGREAPAWGVVGLDGSDIEVTRACREFWKILQPHTQSLMEANPPVPAIGIWKSRKNEIFQFSAHNSLEPVFQNVYGYVNALYWNNFPFRYISGDMLAKGELEHLKLLIMPSAYYLTEEESQALADWVRNGGVLLAEAHLGGYNGTTGRHSRTMPGCGLAAAFGIKESLITSSFHLNMQKAEAFSGDVSADTKKMLESLGVSGSQHFPIRLTDGKIIWGDRRYAELSGSDIQAEGYFEKGKPCAISKAVGAGHVYYFGSRLGSGAVKGDAGLIALLEKACEKAGVRKILNASILSADGKGRCRLDILEKKGSIPFLTIHSLSEKEVDVSLEGEGKYKGLYSGLGLTLGKKATLPPRLTDIFVRQ